VAKTGHGFHVFGLGTVQLGTLQQHGPDAMHMRAVRVFRLLALGVVLAVDGGPLLGDLTGGQPEPETEKMRGNRMQVQSPVRLMPVQIHRHTDHGDMGHRQREQHDLPPCQIPKPMRQPVHHCIPCSPIR